MAKWKNKEQNFVYFGANSKFASKSTNPVIFIFFFPRFKSDKMFLKIANRFLLLPVRFIPECLLINTDISRRLQSLYYQYIILIELNIKKNISLINFESCI